MLLPQQSIHRIGAILEATQRRPRRWRAHARRRGVTLAQLQAAAIVQAIGELLAVSPERGFLLTDCSGEHYWTGSDFRVADASAFDLDELQWYSSRAEARQAAAELRRSHELYLRVVPLHLSDAWQEPGYHQVALILHRSRHEAAAWEALAEQCGITLETLQAIVIVDMLTGIMAATARRAR